jgi:hypothetical protein
MTKAPSPLSIATKAEILRLLEGDPTSEKLSDALHVLAQWRARLVENTLIAQDGETVLAGPFEGMLYQGSDGSAQSRTPRILGTYEQALTPVFAQIIADAPPLIIDIGCGDGYYAVGLALALQQSTVWARDADETAQDQCAALAKLNHVHGRVKVGGKLTHADFDICRAQHTTILCDIAGSTDSLLDPERAKGLRRADILIEVHQDAQSNLPEIIADRFKDTHHIQIFTQSFSSQSLPDWMAGLNDLDRLLALWEWRTSPTQWLWLTRKAT